jgi:predicted transcriptional regulator
MNKRLETLLERVSALPEDAQDELLDHVALIEARQSGIYHLSDDERAAVRRGLEEARQGRFATDEEVEAVFNRYR